MGDWVLAVLIGAAFGLVVGVKIAQGSNAKQSVRGGLPAQVLHYLAGAALSAMLPYIIAGIILGLHFVALFGTALGFLALAALALLLHAVFEQRVETPAAR